MWILHAAKLKILIVLFISRTDIQTYDVSDLYEFVDTTGILERHKQLLSEPFKEGQVIMSRANYSYYLTF